MLKNVLPFLLPILFSSFACAAPSSPDEDAPLRPAQTPAEASCINGQFSKAGLVTHYVVPLLNAYDHQICDQLEGTCIYSKNGQQYLHNYGYSDQLLSQARCKNGYGNRNNCLHPCRVLAASMKHHPYGQIIFIKELVGQKCGNMLRDGFEMVHDGYMVVQDTGAARIFNKTGRFDFFWGRCANYRNGECFEGAVEITNATSYGNYCVVWDPANPKKNAALRDDLIRKVKAEAIQRGDLQAAQEFTIVKDPQAVPMSRTSLFNEIHHAQSLMRDTAKVHGSREQHQVLRK